MLQSLADSLNLLTEYANPEFGGEVSSPRHLSIGSDGLVSLQMSSFTEVEEWADLMGAEYHYHESETTDVSKNELALFAFGNTSFRRNETKFNAYYNERL